VATTRDTINGIPLEYVLRLNQVSFEEGSLLPTLDAIEAEKIKHEPNGETRITILDGGGDPQEYAKGNRVIENMDGLANSIFGQVRRGGKIYPKDDIPAAYAQDVYLEIVLKFLKQK